MEHTKILALFLLPVFLVSLFVLVSDDSSLTGNVPHTVNKPKPASKTTLKPAIPAPTVSTKGLVAFYVKDPKGKPIKGLEVSATVGSNSNPISAITDSAGYTVLNLPTGNGDANYGVVGYTQNYTTKYGYVTVVPRKTTKVNVVLQKMK